MKSILPLASLSLLVLAAPSCVLAAGAAIGAGAMYALGEDSVRIYLDAGMDDVYAASEAEFQDRGSLESLDMGNQEGKLSAKVDDHQVEVFLTRLTDNTTELVVKARQWSDLAPNLELAQPVSDRIAYRLDH